MKKIIFTLLVFHCSLLITNNLFSQLSYKWYEISTGVTSNLNAIYGRYIIGDNGLILFRNYDGTFIQRQSGTSANLYGIYFENPIPTNANWSICGSNGVILITTNNGINWNQQNSGVTATLYSKNLIWYGFPSTRRNFSVGAGGTIIASTNNGVNWITISSPVTVDLKALSFGFSFHFYPGGTIAGNNGTILKTSNGGLNWLVVPSGVTDNLNYLYFSDTASGWAVGNNGKILKTINMGYNWNIISSQTTNNLNFIGAFNNAGYLIAGNNGTVLNSTDGGNNWTNLNANILYDLSSVFYDDTTKTIFAVGKNGKLYARRLDSAYLCNLRGNNISSYFQMRGVFNESINSEYEQVPGFEWPKDSGKTAVFSSGINISGKINGQLRNAIAFYGGEYKPGYCVNGNFQTDNRFKFYKVKRSDNSINNPDWANWGQMVPFGAPFIDVNHNGSYEPLIDTPGVSNASETIFLCFSDADPLSHLPGPGGGGTAPLGAEVHMTSWCYNNASLKDVQFIRWVIINKNTLPWNNTYISIFCDPDIGDLRDDFIGCDTTRKLGFGYNAKLSDTIYGNNPPAFGMDLLKGCLNRNVIPPVNLGLTSFNFTINPSYPPPSIPPCETDPNSPYGAYQVFRGFKRDTTYILDPTYNPPKKTKFAFSGDPETNTGWTAAKGKINNCGGDTSGSVFLNPNGYDMRFFMSSGADNFTMAPNDTQIIIIAQMIARQTNDKSNFSSVTKLKYLDDVAQEVYNSGFNVDIQKNTISIPERFFLSQNYPNPFNPTTKIRFDIPSYGFPIKTFGNDKVVLKVYDVLGKEIQTLVNEKLQPGTYEVTFDGSNYASGVYFYQLKAGDFIETKKLILLK